MSLNDNLGVCAISPKDIDALRMEYLLKKAKAIPSDVIRVFNDMIIEKYSGGSAVLNQQEVVERLVVATNTQRTEIFKYGWLDVEPVFIEAGWKVVYSKSGYNEPEDSKWTFKKE